MRPSTLTLALAALFSTAAATADSRTPEPVPDFTGVGQIRTLHIGQGNEDLGCLTSAGEWTVDEARCGVFAAVRLANNNFHLVASGGGVCGIQVATFRCAEGVRAGIFGTFGKLGPIHGREVLRYGQYGVLATDAEDSPPAPGDAPLAIHFYSGVEKGKWVWLGWKSLFEDEYLTVHDE